MNTQKETTKKVSAPETRGFSEEYWRAELKARQTGEGNAPRVDDLQRWETLAINRLQSLEGALNEITHLKSKIYDISDKARKVAAQRDELLSALKPFLSAVGRIGIKSQDGEILIAGGRLTAQEATQFSDGFVKLSKLLAAIANAEGRAQ